jgi:hypothetical protein
MNFFNTSYIASQQAHKPRVASASTHLYCPNVGVLGDVLVLVQGVLGELALLLFDGLLDEQDHNRL